MLLSKLKHFKVTYSAVDISYSFLRKSFCDIVSLNSDDPTTSMTESPELPGWIKFSETENNPVTTNGSNHPEDEDFLLPTISHWVENHKFQDQKFPNSSEGILSDSVINNDVDKISKILSKPFRSPDDVLQGLNGCASVDVSESLVQQLLKRFSNQWISAFGFFKWAKLQMGFNHPPDSYNSMVDILGKSKKFELMWELMEEMDELGGCITLVTMTKVMRRLARSGRYEDAIEAFRKMEQFGVMKDVAAVNALMDALVKEQSVEHAQNVFIEFKNYIPPNPHTFNILIHGWCKVRQMDRARKTMEEMENHGFHPDVLSYTCFIEAYCRDKDFRKVDAVLEEMQQKGCPPNAVTYTIVLHAFGKAKEINKAIEVYKKMKRDGCILDSWSYSSLIYILSSAGRLRDACDIFEDMPNHGVTPDILTYNTMITAACNHSREEDALKLLQRMEESHCKPDLKTYHPLLKMCCRKKRIKVLSFLLSHMLKNDVSLELGTYSLLVQGLRKSGKLEHACSYFEEMVSRGFIPRVSTYEMLIEELARKGMEKAKKQIEELMLRSRG
ncbi:pentatricopeptide repeat-containing protein At3g22670, mitochondrial [Cornus florida]|uniref:pentatricopeptide repeat-containing protein At3g22670, mitochondrial n=1 Tax=Cornus florida TaxID=4283 RepID=UPI0028A142E8|nr:pentatricopeptide repeat-containing protein At3g22670, mitochondrial [Cornus florida]